MPVKVRASSIEEFEKKFEKKDRSTNTIWPTRLGAKGRNSITVHFLTDVDEWAEFGQFWIPSLGRFVIETEENSEEMEELAGRRASTINLAAALDVTTGQVIVIQIPWSLAEDIKTLRAKQWDKQKATLTELDIELEKSGSGVDTKYRAYPEGKSAIDVTRFPIPNGKESWKMYLFDLVEKLAYPEGKDEDVEDSETDTDVDVPNDTDVEEVEEEVTEAPKAKRVLKRKVG